MFWNNTLKLLYLCYISSHYFKGYKDILKTKRKMLSFLLAGHYSIICIVSKYLYCSLHIVSLVVKKSKKSVMLYLQKQ